MLLDITGWVRNLPDGSVEGRATGDEAMLETFRTWLNRGPVAATVLNLEWEETELQRFDGFHIH
jgi:acylphosphatase